MCGGAGSSGPGTAFDLQGYVDQRLQAGAKRIVIPPGRCRVKPQRAQHLVLKGLSDVLLIADNVEMICTETSRALTIAGCTNVTVRGLTIDYDPLPFTQGRIVRLSEDKKVHDIELFEGCRRPHGSYAGVVKDLKEHLRKHMMEVGDQADAAKFG
jgi:hypothetical protein